jgi:AcrR family transcriptional regulator
MFSKIRKAIPLSRRIWKINMGQIHNGVKRGRGRPPIRPDDATRRLIIDAARQEFQANGYAATCMEDVARRAGVSTKTLYRLIPTKADLFKSVVSDRIGRFLLEIDDGVVVALDLAAALEHILIAYGELALDPETIAINRLVIAESDRFPEIAAAFHETALVQTNRAIESWLRRQCERGLIRLNDPHAASGMLRGMMVMQPQRAVMLGQRAAPDANEIANRARTVSQLFLNGCRA